MQSNLLIYDDTCPLCTRFAASVQARDTAHLIELVPLSNPILPETIPLPPRDRLQQEIHLILPDHRILAGSDAVAELALMLPKYRLLGKMMRLRGIRSLAKAIYRLVARNRPHRAT